MKSKNYIIFGILLLVLGAVNERFYYKSDYQKSDVELFQSQLNGKVAMLNEFINSHASHFYADEQGDDIPPDDGMMLFCFRNDSLVYWTDNNIDARSIVNLPGTDTVAFAGNAWVYKTTLTKGNVTHVGVVLIKYQYEIQNSFLKNHFTKGFKMSSEVNILTEYSKGAYPIKVNGKEVFFLQINNVLKKSLAKKVLALISYLLALFSVLYAIYWLVIGLYHRFSKGMTLFAAALLIIAIRGIIQGGQWPAIWYETDLFQPEFFAHSKVFPSLGDFLLSSLFILFFNLITFRVLAYDEQQNKKSFHRLVILLFLVLANLAMLFFSMDTLVFNSNLSFETYLLKGLELFSFIGLLVVFIQSVSLFLISYRFSEYLYKHKAPWLLVTTLSIMIVNCFVLKVALGITFISIGGMLLWLLLIYLFTRRGAKMFELSTITILLFVLSINVSVGISKKQIKKEYETKKIIANNLAYEHDPVAELLLEGVSAAMVNDTLLMERVYNFDYSLDDILTYVKKNYFTGFWNKYDLQISLCTPTDSLLLNKWVPCYLFFNDNIKQNGHVIPNTTFYYLDNLNGRISYLGHILFIKNGQEYSLFIELNSKLTTQPIGYPELLLDEKVYKQSMLNDYSYAKYLDNELITQSGAYQYSLELVEIPDNTVYFTFQQSGYSHLAYNIDNENTIVVSHKSPGVLQYLISFSYILAFYYLILVCTYILFRRSYLQKLYSQSFHYRLQVSMLTILILSMVLIGGGSIYFAINQYRNNLNILVEEKIQSVFIELDHKLSMLETIDEYWYSDKYGTLDQLLIKFSDVFYSDINLFYPDGRLMATSRREVFDKNLAAPFMEPLAYQKMAIEKQAKYVQTEKIGNMKYLSVYIPFINYENQLLAYLNLPYFTNQDMVKAGVISLVVAIVNIYTLLFMLSIVAAVIISRQITSPLASIRNKMQEIKLTTKNETIEYTANDEIGQLVSEYNRMIAELERSASLLAQNERDLAWREMARQIAHEIKNPLTPMRLSLQHMQRSWVDHKDNLDEYIKNIADSLIEQIDNLSGIASAFSNFASMPKANNERFDLVKKLKSITRLFAEQNQGEIITDIKADESFIIADKEQMVSILNNLLKNAIQSIPKERKGRIVVALENVDSEVHVSIHDNGKGVPDDIKDKLFQPMFTTKLSGTGLGLSITKSIINGMGGNIWFETKINYGSIFRFSIPLALD